MSHLSSTFFHIWVILFLWWWWIWSSIFYKLVVGSRGLIKLRLNSSGRDSSLVVLCVLKYISLVGKHNARQSCWWCREEAHLSNLFTCPVPFVSKRENSYCMATHSSTLAWKIPWMEEPVGLQCMGLQRVGHDWGTSLNKYGAARVAQW